LGCEAYYPPMALLDDLVSEPIQQWNSTVLTRMREDGKGETLFFEFKSTHDCEAIDKAVCAFANRLGGFLMLGVTAGSLDNTIDGYPGLSGGTDWLRSVSDCIVGHVSPLPAFDTVQIPSPDDTTKYVVVTRVEASENTPHMLTRNGRIYLRGPAGSDLVTDKATLDTLISRGGHGTEVVNRRADTLHSVRHGADLLPDGGCFVAIAVVPYPSLSGGALDDIVTASGFDRAGSVFAHPAVRGTKPHSFGEDHVVVVGGGLAGARYTDGSIYLQGVVPGSYLSVDLVADLARASLAASSYQVPAVHQVVLDVRILGAQYLKLDPDGVGRDPAARQFGVGLWPFTRVTGTSTAAIDQIAAEMARRLWRTTGDPRGLEPARVPEQSGADS
jgi:hypothetical protein